MFSKHSRHTDQMGQKKGNADFWKLFSSPVEVLGINSVNARFLRSFFAMEVVRVSVQQTWTAVALSTAYGLNFSLNDLLMTVLT